VRVAARPGDARGGRTGKHDRPVASFPAMEGMSIMTRNESSAERTGLTVLPVSLRGLRDAVLAGSPSCVCDPELFTGPAGIEPDDELHEARAARVEVARQVCAACPVRQPCLAYALRIRPAAGVWAGCIPEEITALIAAAARPARVQRATALRPVAAGCQPAAVAS
jgi:WhiB family redox-sensing transcriptional regulator